MSESILIYFAVWLVLLLLCLYGIKTFAEAKAAQILYVVTAVVFGLVFVFYILIPLIRAAPM